MDYIQKDLDLIRMATESTENAEQTPKRKKKIEKTEPKIKKSEDGSTTSSSNMEKVAAKKRAKTLSPGKLKKEIKEMRIKEKPKSRKSLGNVKGSQALGRIKFGPSIKKPATKQTKVSTPRPKKKQSLEVEESKSPATTASQPEKEKMATKKAMSPTVSSKSRKGLDPDAVPLEAIRFVTGSKLEAVDNGIWYKARIVTVDEDNMDILIHFDGWGSRFDTWFPMTSSLIRGRTQLDTKPGTPKYVSGEDVLAKWTDGNFYPATVLNVKESGSCLVMYFDGMKKLLRPNMIKKMSEKEKEAAMKAVEKLLLLPPNEGASSLSPGSAGSPSSSDGATFRRYRTSANDREKRIAARSGNQVSKTPADGAPQKRAKKRRASQMIPDIQKSASVVLIPADLPAKTSPHSSDDEVFNAKKARLDKITHNLLDRASPTSDSENKKQLDSKDKAEAPPSMDSLSGHGDSDSDSPLVIDEESVAPSSVKHSTKQMREKEPTGARGPRAGIRNAKSKQSLQARIKGRSQVKDVTNLDKKSAEKVTSRKSGEENLHQLADAALASSSPIPLKQSEKADKEMEGLSEDKPEYDTRAESQSGTSTKDTNRESEPRSEASEALLKLAQAYADTTDNSTDGSTNTTPTKELETSPLAEESGNKSAKNNDALDEEMVEKPEVRELVEPESEANINASGDVRKPSPIYKKGDIVLAKWADCRSYLAYILRKESEDNYKIRYYDGMVKVVKSSFLHPWVGSLPAALQVFKHRAPTDVKKRRSSADLKHARNQRAAKNEKLRQIRRKRTISLPETDKSAAVRRRSRTTSEETPLDTIQYTANEKVLAKWTDFKWYPATVVTATDNYHYEVRYHDGHTRKVRDTWLTPWNPPSQNKKQNEVSKTMDTQPESEKVSPKDKRETEASKKTEENLSTSGEKAKQSEKETPEEGSITKTGDVIGLGEQAWKTYENFQVGDTVLARWTDCRSYPATVKKVQDDGKYVVEYFDGMQKALKPDWLKSWNPTALPPQPVRRRGPKRASDTDDAGAKKSPEPLKRGRLAAQDSKPGRLLPAKQPSLPRQVVRGYDAYYARLPPATKDLIIDTNVNKFKCRVPGCTKSFRKEELLRQHHKYYHQQRYKLRDLETPAPAPKRRSSKEDSASATTRRRVSADYEAIQKSLETPALVPVQEKTNSQEVGRPKLRSRGAKPPMDIYKQQHGNISISSASSMLDSSSGVDDAKPPTTEEVKPVEESKGIKVAENGDSSVTPTESKHNKRKRKRQESEQATAKISAASPKEQVEEVIEVEKVFVPESPVGEEPVNEDVIRCPCGVEEEEGFMIQCEGCFTWQHATCVGVDEKTKSKSGKKEGKKISSEVEKKDSSAGGTAEGKVEESEINDETYICWVCKNPQNVRSSKKFLYSNEFLMKGKLPSLSNLEGSSKEKEENGSGDKEKHKRSFDVMFLAINQLMDEVVKMQETLQGIKQKIQIVASPEEHPLLKTFQDETVSNSGEKPLTPKKAGNGDTSENRSTGEPSAKVQQETQNSEGTTQKTTLNEDFAATKGEVAPTISSEIPASKPAEASDDKSEKVMKNGKKKGNGAAGRRSHTSSTEMSANDREVYIHRCRDKLLDHILELEKTLANRLNRLEDYVANIDTDDEGDEGNEDIGKLKDDLTAVQKLLLCC